MSRIKIALDAGHGLNTAGKQTPDGIKEWTLNDKVRDKVAALLSEYDVEIIHTDNDEGAVDEGLSSRVNKYVSAGVAAFVSIHHNAFTGDWNGATGVEVYTDKNPTAKDTQLATLIYNKMVAYTGLKGRGIKKAAFTVINQNTVPAILCEGGFMDGTNDYKIITSDAGQSAYAKAVAEGLIEFLGIAKKTAEQPTTTPAPTEPTEIDVTYQVWDDVKNTWLPNVKNLDDYAGIFGHDVCALFASLSSGNIFYRVHTKGGKWLPEVKNREDYAGIFNKPIDALCISTDTGKTVKYAVHLRRSKRWLPFVTGYNTADSNNGYAGILGQEIDAVKICIE